MRAHILGVLTSLLLPRVVHAAVDPGEILISEMNCAACHEPADTIKARLASRPSPRLDAEHAVRVTPQWLRAFLENPQATQPNTLMPDLLAGFEPAQRAEAAEALTHYLVELRGPAKAAPAQADGNVLQAGKTLYHTIGCVACHAPEELPAEKVNAPEAWAELEKLRQTSVPLGSLEQKYTTAELAAFLQDPLKSRPGGRMPSFKLTDAEAHAIAAYLLRAAPQEKTPAFSIDAVKATRGKELFATLNCAACHQVDGPGRKAKPMERLIGRQPGGCLGTKPKPGVPKFEISDRQRVVILAQLGNQASMTEPLTPEQQITRTMMTLNCYSCHARERRGGVDPSRREYFTSSVDLGDEGRIPPTLRGVGAKLRLESLKEALVGNSTVRPSMPTRMPLYGDANVGHLPELFAQADARPEALPSPAINHPSVASDADHGRKLIGAGGLNCIACHNFNGHPSPGVPGLDLAGSAPRLNWDWFRRYLLDPQSIRSGTRMPTFWPEGVATNKEILGGDTEKQIQSIWTYLMRKDFDPLPPGLPPAKKVK